MKNKVSRKQSKSQQPGQLQAITKNGESSPNELSCQAKHLHLMLKICKFKEAGLTEEHSLVGNRGPRPEKMHLHLPTICFVHQGYPLLPPELILGGGGATLKQAIFSRAVSHLALPQSFQARAGFLQAWREDRSPLNHQGCTGCLPVLWNRNLEAEPHKLVFSTSSPLDCKQLEKRNDVLSRAVFLEPRTESMTDRYSAVIYWMDEWIPGTTSFGMVVSVQRKGLLEELRPGAPGGAGQDLLDSGLGTGLSHLPPLPRPVAQPHLNSPSPGPEPRNATVQSNASLSSKLPDQPSWLLRTGI